jgi:putative ABC transport system substrate-binding protein
VRRRLVILGTLAMLAAPVAGAPQVGRIARIGYLSPAVNRHPSEDVFEESLAALGWIKDQNLKIEYRYAAGRQDRFDSLAAELVASGVNVLVTWKLHRHRATRSSVRR